MNILPIRALQTISTTQEGFYKGDTLAEIFENQTKNGKINEALGWANTRKDPLEKSYALIGIATGLLKTNNSNSTR